MPRKGETGVRRAALRDFRSIYEALADEYGDPVEALFCIATDQSAKTEHRIASANILIRHRHPTPAPANYGDEAGDGQVTMVWGHSSPVPERFQ